MLVRSLIGFAWCRLANHNAESRFTHISEDGEWLEAKTCSLFCFCLFWENTKPLHPFKLCFVEDFSEFTEFVTENQ